MYHFLCIGTKTTKKHISVFYEFYLMQKDQRLDNKLLSNSVKISDFKLHSQDIEVSLENNLLLHLIFQEETDILSIYI